MPQFLHGAVAPAAACLLFAASRLWFNRRDEAETASLLAIAQVTLGTLGALAAYGWLWSLDPAFADWPRERTFGLAAFAAAVAVAAAACLPSPFGGSRTAPGRAGQSRSAPKVSQSSMRPLA